MLIQADLGALKTPPGKLAGAGEPLNPEVIEQVDTGDVAARDPEGYITYVGRADDVFKASGYRISPFERSATSGRTWPRTSESGVSSSVICRRRSRGRSAGWSCASGCRP
jgi:acyl-CoA synthetase (AMP-forming)/AMP-acid ligase II